MQCTEIQPLFTEYADNTLAREELHALTEHLFGCPACALEWRQFQQTLNLMHGLETQAPPPDLLSGIQAKLAKKGIFDRVWAFVESMDFSLSIPAAVTIFTIAMLAGFLLKTSPVEQASPPAQISALPQGEIHAPQQPPIAAKTLFAVSHDEDRQGGTPAPLARTALATQQAPDNAAPRLLSPDIHVLIKDIDHDSRVALCQEMVRRNWQLNQISGGLFLVHLPQAELGAFHELVGHHRFALMPAAAAGTGFGSDKTVLTAAIRFQ